MEILPDATPCYTDDAVLAFYMMRANTFQRVFWNQLGDDNLLSKFFRIALEGEAPASYLYFETDNSPEIRHLLLQIYQEHQLEEPYAPQMINSLMRLLFLLILRRYEGTARLPRTEFFFWKHQFSAILSYIQTHYQEATLEKVAEKFNYSPKQVGRIVKDCTGEAFGDVIRSMKMKKAAELLLDRRYLWALPRSTAFIVFSRIITVCRRWNGYRSSRIVDPHKSSLMSSSSPSASN